MLKVTITPPAAGTTAPVRTLAPADVRHPVFHVLGGRSSLGLVKFRADRHDSSERMSNAGAVYDRGSGARGVRGVGWASRRARLRSGQPVE